VESRVARQSCRICYKSIEPVEPVFFQHGELIHMTCYKVQPQAVRRGTGRSYKRHSIHVVCYPFMGRWRPAALVKSPGRSTRLGRMKLCASAEEALAVALEMATAWVDDASAPRVQPGDTCGEDLLRGH
jgi:hypothetical protein